MWEKIFETEVLSNENKKSLIIFLLWNQLTKNNGIISVNTNYKTNSGTNQITRRQ